MCSIDDSSFATTVYRSPNGAASVRQFVENVGSWRSVAAVQKKLTPGAGFDLLEHLLKVDVISSSASR